MPCWPATPRPALPPRRPRRGAWPARRLLASTCRTRCSAGRGSSTSCALPDMLHGRVLRPAGRAPSSRRSMRSRRARCRASSRSCATAASSASSPRPRGCRRCRPRGPAQGRGMERGLRACPTRRKLCRLAQEPARRDHDRRRAQGCHARRKSPRPSAGSYSRPFIAHASMAPSCAIAQWRRPDKVRGLVALPGRLQSARRPGAGAGAAAGEHRRSARRGRRLLRPERRR